MKTGSEIIVDVLAEEGVETIFGYSGGAILPTYDEVFKYNEANPEKQMPLIVPSNEQGAGFMASGYARSSGKPGVVMVTSGPGATNTVTPVRDAMADSIPMVIICGQVSRQSIGSDAFQEAPITSVMGSVAKHVFLVTNENKLAATLKAAFEIAKSGRPGPVVVDIPKDVQTAEISYEDYEDANISAYNRRILTIQESRLTQEKSSEFFEHLSNSKKPLIYFGGGVISANASKELREFIDYFNLPAVSTLMGLGAVDTQHQSSLHMLGMHGTPFANYAVQESDFLIAIGSRFDDRVAGVPEKFAPEAKIIAHFDVDPSEINKVKNAAWAHLGFLSLALKDLMEHAKREELEFNFNDWFSHTNELKSKYPLNFNRSAELIQPEHVIECINKITKGDAIVTTGVGQHQMWAAQYFDFKNPRLWLTSGSMGTMGFGIPAAIGAQFAHPDKTVIDIDGDGSIRMNLGDLETITNYDLPVKVLLLNNSGDGMVKQWQKLYYGGRLSASDKTLHTKDFVMSAKSDGFEFAERLTDQSKVEETIKRFINFEKAAFLEVIIDPEAMVFPMIGPGMSYDQMITGPFMEGKDPDPEIDGIDPKSMF